MNKNSNHKASSMDDRISFIKNKVDSLSKSDSTFADKLYLSSLESHLSDLNGIALKESLNHPFRDFLELRLKGTVVDLGTIPLSILSTFSKNLEGLILKASNKISSGKDQRSAPQALKKTIDLRLANISHGSTRLGVSFNSNTADNGEMFETTTSKAVSDIFTLLESVSDDDFINNISEIGYNSAISLREIINECRDNDITFDMSWTGPFSNGKKQVTVNKKHIDRLHDRLNTTQVVKPRKERISGELAVLSKYGKFDVLLDDGSRIRIDFPVDKLDEIQKIHKVGSRITFDAEVTEIFNTSIHQARQNYRLISIK
ncbi:MULTISPECIES: hypothetical protein [Providencia]|uniref:Uncharacterized protein n=1 Tax=Providencia stuartii TaxID=588 RepID=A0A1S1HM52_PROST|nr:MULTISPECIES: hypothetical protein [unclassified Providencia]OHT23137.1 hypothetical protein A3Q29_06815 [Providencia stuartii]